MWERLFLYIGRWVTCRRRLLLMHGIHSWSDVTLCTKFIIFIIQFIIAWWGATYSLPSLQNRWWKILITEYTQSIRFYLHILISMSHQLLLEITKNTMQLNEMILINCDLKWISFWFKSFSCGLIVHWHFCLHELGYQLLQLMNYKLSIYRKV